MLLMFFFSDRLVSEKMWMEMVNSNAGLIISVEFLRNKTIGYHAAGKECSCLIFSIWKIGMIKDKKKKYSFNPASWQNDSDGTFGCNWLSDVSLSPLCNFQLLGHAALFLYAISTQKLESFMDVYIEKHVEMFDSCCTWYCLLFSTTFSFFNIFLVCLFLLLEVNHNPRFIC